jgi:hypothetical protein
MALFKRGGVWWYEFLFARRRVRESAKTTSKTVAKQAEQNRRRELERGFNGVEDNREDRIRTIKELGRDYLDEYRVRHRASSSPNTRWEMSSGTSARSWPLMSRNRP